MFTEKFISNQLAKDINSQVSSTVVKDFTLTNVRGNATMYDIK
jgi:hypothetical protein